MRPLASALLVGLLLSSASVPAAALSNSEPERIILSAEQIRLSRQLRQRPIRSLLNITTPMRHGEFVWNDRQVPPGPLWIRVDPQAQIISAFRSGHEIGTAVILYGVDRHPTPTGTFRIIARIKDHRSSLYDAPMPYTLRFTGDGVAIHGSDVRWGTASHGCVGVPVEFARRLFQQAKLGDPIVVLPHRR